MILMFQNFLGSHLAESFHPQKQKIYNIFQINLYFKNNRFQRQTRIFLLQFSIIIIFVWSLNNMIPINQNQEAKKAIHQLFITAQQALRNFLQRQNADYDSKQTPLALLQRQLVEQEQVNHQKCYYKKIQLFQSIPQIENLDILSKKLSQLKLNFVSSRRRDQLFKRFRKQQEQKLQVRKKQVQKNYQFPKDIGGRWSQQLKLKGNNKEQITIEIGSQDIEKLRPDTDLNDTIIDAYFKFLQHQILPQNIANKTFIFSTFFMDKLLDQFIKEDSLFLQKQTENLYQVVRNRVKQNYHQVKRWTRKVKIFEMDCLVIPINACHHWNCLIVKNPGCIINPNLKGQLLYCDSMCQKKGMLIQAFRMYLQLELKDKQQIDKQVSQASLPAYQLLLPRQTNSHDCGLYMLAYCQFLLSNYEKQMTVDFSKPQNRKKLNLFPRCFIFSMRQRLRKLFTQSKDMQKTKEAINNYKQIKAKILQDGYTNQREGDFDSINQKQFNKYYKMNGDSTQDKQQKKINSQHQNQMKDLQWHQEKPSSKGQQENRYGCQVKFYLDTQINFYEKDR